jgi:Tol biopolymer transport system component
VDARPAFSPDGQTILFMRGPQPTGEPSSLYTISIHGGEAQKLEPVDCPEHLSLTRPDWSWRRHSFEIAFAGSLPAKDGNREQSNIYLLDVATRACRLLLQGFPEANQVYSYPSWYPRGKAVAVTNYWFGVDQAGCSKEPDPQQFLLRQDVLLPTRRASAGSRRHAWPRSCRAAM